MNNYTKIEKSVNVDKDELKQFIAGKEMNLAQQLGIIGEGKANDEEHHQPCPLDGCASDDDGFYIRTDGSFHCRTCSFNGDLFALVMKHRNVEFPAALQIVADAVGYVGDKPKIKKRSDERKTSHVYHGEDGKEVYRIIRTDYTDEQGKPGKSFCPAYQEDAGKTVYREYGVHYPYRLPDVLQAKTLFIVEGEKCADVLNGVLRGEKNIATTSQGGSQRGSLWKEFLQMFPDIAKKTIRILPDNDAPGMKYAQAVATAMLESNPSADVKIIELPGLPPKGDVCDWIADLEMNGKDESAAVETLSALCINAEPVTAETIASWNQPKPKPAESAPVAIVPCGIDALDNILENIEPVDWTPFQTSGRGGETRPPSEKIFILRTVEKILHTADKENTPIVNHTGVIYYFTGTHYKAVTEIELTKFLIEAASRCGVPSDTAIYQTFAEKIVKQFFINTARHHSGVSEPDTMFMNLQNGTLFFDKKGHRFENHSPQRFIRYCLTFDYDSKATAPRWQQHLDRSLPISEKQQYLAECLALPFYQGKIEKAPIFYGQSLSWRSGLG